MMPSSVLPSSTTGRPETRYSPQQLVELLERRLRADRDRVGDDAGLGPLHQVDLVGLVLDRQVAVQHADAALAGHRDRHPRLGDGVHGARHQRHPQADRRGSAGTSCRPRWGSRRSRPAAAARRRRSARARGTCRGLLLGVEAQGGPSVARPDPGAQSTGEPHPPSRAAQRSGRARPSRCRRAARRAGRQARSAPAPLVLRSAGQQQPPVPACSAARPGHRLGTTRRSGRCRRPPTRIRFDTRNVTMAQGRRRQGRRQRQTPHDATVVASTTHTSPKALPRALGDFAFASLTPNVRTRRCPEVPTKHDEPPSAAGACTGTARLASVTARPHAG